MSKAATAYPLETLKRMEVMDRRCRQAAREHFAGRCRHYLQFTGGSYSRITVRDQKTRWGSCSSTGTLSFNYRLMFAPPRVLDYVVIHELCHLTHMNHSREFWNLVASVMPEYKIHRNWLKEHGQELHIENHMKRLNLL